ncbi:DUF4231 domain-containing protein [Streptomyces sp. HNM0663]|uniref:DUF4231 domain-containing protein n=1 Tax=Streptomyces chengmaiensis TaxID=3040919 RepID=A0ABT6HHN5_9ACTN|nr:DUF4231 domain-containing protein [Streptomyces chengmaiensis]MDH2387790.1 DUF4231 domain-containing protein [Streptomyces chengmaiensis]
MRAWWRRFRAPAAEEFLEAPDEELDAAAERYVQRLRRFYDVRARWHRRGYRLTGIVVILVGALLPFLATAEYAHKESVLALAGVTISVVTALRSFFRFDQSWVLLRNAEIAITEEYLGWKLQRRCDGEQPAAAARRLIEAVVRIRRDEAGEYFKELPSPQPGVDGQVSVPTPGRRQV